MTSDSRTEERGDSPLLMVGQHTSEEELDEILKNAGWRRATYIEKPTHAICIHGALVPIDADDHKCQWWPLTEYEKNTRI